MAADVEVVDWEQFKTSKDHPGKLLHFEEDKQLGTHCIIVQNLDSKETLMLHVDEHGNRGLFSTDDGVADEQREIVDDFLKTPGRKIAVRILDGERTGLCDGAVNEAHEGVGDKDHGGEKYHDDDHSAKYCLESRGVPFIDDILLHINPPLKDPSRPEAGYDGVIPKYWEATFDPQTCKVTVAKDSGEVLRDNEALFGKTHQEEAKANFAAFLEHHGHSTEVTAGTGRA